MHEVSVEWQHDHQRRELGIINNSTHETMAFHLWSLTFKLKLMVGGFFWCVFFVCFLFFCERKVVNSSSLDKFQVE